MLDTIPPFYVTIHTKTQLVPLNSFTYLDRIKHRSVIIGVRYLDYSGCSVCQTSAFHICSLNYQRILRNFLQRKVDNEMKPSLVNLLALGAKGKAPPQDSRPRLTTPAAPPPRDSRPRHMQKKYKGTLTSRSSPAAMTLMSPVTLLMVKSPGIGSSGVCFRME